MTRTQVPWDIKKAPEATPAGYVRERSDPRYHSARWTRLSQRWRISHPLCEECRRQGIITAADCVDHIVPVQIHGDFFDETNLQSLCNRCNMLKGERDRKRIQEWKRQQLEGVGGSNLSRESSKDQSPGLARMCAKF